jgi:hypothetical protein
MVNVLSQPRPTPFLYLMTLRSQADLIDSLDECITLLQAWHIQHFSHDTVQVEDLALRSAQRITPNLFQNQTSPCPGPLHHHIAALGTPERSASWNIVWTTMLIQCRSRPCWQAVISYFQSRRRLYLYLAFFRPTLHSWTIHNTRKPNSSAPDYASYAPLLKHACRNFKEFENSLRQVRANIVSLSRRAIKWISACIDASPSTNRASAEFSEAPIGLISHNLTRREYIHRFARFYSLCRIEAHRDHI